MPHHTPISGVCLITFWISNLLRRVFPYQRAGPQADFGSLQALALQLARVYAQRPSCFVSFSIMFFSGKHKSEFVIVQIEVILDSNNNNLEPDSWSNWNLKCWFLRRGENRSTRRKTCRSKGENQPQTQRTYGVDAGIWTRATLVEGERSHFCTIPCYESFSFSFPSLKRWPPRLHFITL